MTAAIPCGTWRAISVLAVAGLRVWDHGEMPQSADDLVQRLHEAMQSLEPMVDGGSFHGVHVRREGDRFCMVFRWCDDPNVYELWSAVDGAPWAWEEMDRNDGIELHLMEELDTGFLLRATKTRHEQALRIDLDTGQLRDIGDNSYYLSELLSYVGHLDEVGLDTAPGLAARRAGTLLGWTSAAVNSKTGGPELAQIVTVRDSGVEAQIVHLELTRRAQPMVGYELVFSAIHKAARHGIHRLYSPRAIAYVEHFGFAAAGDRAGMVVYDITSRDLNWPEELTAAAAT
jgi:hypothetical protein